MRFRPALLALVVAMLVASGCAEGDGTPEASADATPGALAETTLDGCVIDQGAVAPKEATGDDFDTMKDGVLVVGSDTAFPPFEEIKDGEAVGFDIDMIKEVAERIGSLEVEVQTAAFDTIFTSLAADKFDVVISAVTIKSDRKQTVDFTDPYFKADQSVSVRRADAESIGGVEDLEGKIVGVQSGTTGEDCAKNVLKKDGMVKEFRSYDTAPDAFSDLQANRIDAVLVDLPTAQQIVEERTAAVVVQKVLTKEEYGIAVSKENPNLREAINDALDEIEQDGTYDELFMKWFDTEPPE